MTVKFNVEVEFELMEVESVSDQTLINRIKDAIDGQFESKSYKEDDNIRIISAEVVVL